METYAGFLEHTDREVGRLVQGLRDLGQLDNTLFVYIVGDNGASGEGGPEGAYNEILALNGIVAEAASQLPHLEEWGGPATFPHYSVGWAHALDTPFQWTKQVASHFGGTRNAMVVHWPAKLKGKEGGLRSQFHHVVDIAPTVLEAAGLPEPKIVNGAEQRPMDGVSMLYAFEDEKAKDRHTTQYFEIFGNRGIYHDGWVAATRHSTPWAMVPLPPLEQDRWELYHVDTDFSEAHDLAAKHPEKLAELQELFKQEAIKNHVYPIDDRRAERFDAKIAGRPDPIGDRKTMELGAGMTGITENTFINIKGRSHSITAEIEVPKGPAEGVLIAQAGRFGGWSLYLKKGKPHYVYNFGGLELTTVAGKRALLPGKHRLVYEFTWGGGKPGTGGKGKLLVDGELAGEITITKMMPFIYSADEGVDIGTDNETTVTPDYKQGDNHFTGTINKITVALTD
jgi:arylsulfatase